MKSGIQLISNERSQQLLKHKITVEDDVKKNPIGQLIIATKRIVATGASACPIGWNRINWEKILIKPYKERLIIAGALIAAEIDRLQYIEQSLEKANEQPIKKKIILMQFGTYTDGGTIEFQDKDNNRYFLDGRIGTSGERNLYNKYPGDKGAKILNKEDYELKYYDHSANSKHI